MTHPQERHVTVDEYLQLEGRSVHQRHEYVRGRVYAMSPARLAHQVIAGNLFSALHVRLRGGRCRAFMDGGRVRLEEADMYVYPDVTAVCGRVETEDRYGTETILNPTLVAEVLSPSTERFDRRDKSDGYRQRATLREHLLLAQDRPRVERFLLDGDRWVPSVIEGLDAVLTLSSLGIEIPMAEVYENVDFAAAARRPRRVREREPLPLALVLDPSYATAFTVR